MSPLSSASFFTLFLYPRLVSRKVAADRGNNWPGDTLYLDAKSSNHIIKRTTHLKSRSRISVGLFPTFYTVCYFLFLQTIT